MAKKIISVGFDFPGHFEFSYDYSSNQSLLDADIVLFEPNFSGYSTDYPSTYNGKTIYTKDASFQLQEHTQHWRKELTTALEDSKTVIVFFRKFEEFYIHTGRKDVSGSGRNARVTNIVTEYNNYNFFPGTLHAPVPKSGKEVVFSGPALFAEYWNEYKDNIKYESYLEGAIGSPILTTKTGGKIVATHIKIGTGNLFLLPPINYKEEDFLEHEVETDETFWTDEADRFGAKLLQIILNIDQHLKTDDAGTPPPAWALGPEFELGLEKVIKTEIEGIGNEIDELVLKKTEAMNRLDQETQFKALLFEKGRPLERAIILALTILGYSAEHFDNGELELDQIISSPEGERYIGEAEGKDNAAINVDKFRQLTSNIQEDFKRDGIDVPAVGILFGNGQRLFEPSQRKEQFTEKCLKLAASNNCILVRTPDLYKVVKYIKDSNDVAFGVTCRTAIAASKGKIVEFPGLPEKKED